MATIWKRQMVLLAASVVIAASALVARGQTPPDPRPGASMPTREQNYDANGYIAVHEQGVAAVNVTGGQIDANITNSTLDVTGAVEVTNLPAVQDVNVVGGPVEVRHPAVTAGQGLRDSVAAGDTHTIRLESPIYAT
ncbi:MAG: hypothetical protein IH608_03000, partial [Proteobacteria bacterium]|nr:hypothetical protein [Pseudomonadota bacterium]